MPHLTPYLRAGYAGIVLITHEEARSFAWLQHTARESGYSLREWNAVDGLIHHSDTPPTVSATDEGLPELLRRIPQMPAKTLVLIRDAHLFLSEPSPFLYRQFKQTLQHAKANEITLVLPMPELKLPVDLEKWFTVLDFDLPTRDEMTAMLRNLIEGDTMNRTLPEGEALDILLDAAAGLTAPEAEDAFALSLLGNTTFDPAIVLREKAATIRKNGLVEYLEPKLTLDDVGGWDAFKAAIHVQRHQFSKAADAYRLKPTKGVLLVGQGGTGKSLIAPIIGTVLSIPVLRLDASDLMGSLVGQSEGNWKKVMQIARSLGKCVLYIDEVDGLTAGAASSGKTDGGTTSRLIKSFLQDIQDSHGIFFVFTANDIDNIPDPLIDRLDLWSVELPNDTERGEIWQIQMRHTGREHKTVCPKGLMNIVKLTDGFSGRQIERVWTKALCHAFNDGQREPQEKDILDALKGEVPTSTTMKAQIDARRARLEGKAKPVTSPTMKKLLSGNTRNIAG